MAKVDLFWKPEEAKLPEELQFLLDNLILFINLQLQG